MLVRRMPRSESVGPRLEVWETGDLVVIVSGVGKVAAAIAAQYACDVLKPRCLVAIGLAGGMSDSTRQGRVIVASGAAQHDMDGRPLATRKGELPSLGLSVIEANPATTQTLLRGARYRSEDARAGLVLTGDQVIMSRAMRDALAREFPGAECVDMETAAVAQVAHQNGVPWSAVRITSDSADESFDLKGVIGFGADTAANVFDSIIQAVLDEL